MLRAINSWILDLYTRVKTQDEGQTMAEYGLILAVIAVVAVVAFIFLGTAISDKVSAVATAVSNPAP